MPTGAWPQGVIMALTALCALAAFRVERAPERPVRAAGPVTRIGWPVLAALVGMAAYGSVSVLVVDLHNPGAHGNSVFVNVPDLASVGVLPVALLLAGLLATMLLRQGPAPRPGLLPVVAVASGELLVGVNAVAHGHTLRLDLLPAVLGVLVLAAVAGIGLVRPAAGRAGRPAGNEAARSARWALLLPAVVVMLGGLSSLDPWSAAPPDAGIGGAVTAYFVGLALLAATVVLLVRRPRAAADLAVLGLLGIGVNGIVQGIFGRSLVVRTFGAGSWPVSGFSADAANHLVVLGGIQGTLLLALGLRLLPLTVLPDARRLLGREPDPALARRVRVLTETRAEAVSSAAAELRRIERDLHDGAQGRLVAIGMNLLTAEEILLSSPQEAVALVAEARVSSAAALEELRSLVRGIYPPVLADRGLGEAVRALALDLPLPCVTEIEPLGELGAPIESACYFAVAEVVTNAVRHASASSLRISMARTGGQLRIEVVDDGVGGADPAAGSGLAGVERRLAAFDGILAISSPPGGPTIVVMEVPCG
ncbi:MULTISPECIES: histidine kinase [Streptacidiphilus]|uniref:histidine kinase n=1 Tax=Streptacidiphilus cavernicola TaxID=3342716 RepID=A0ABV6UYM9_9ACTN|nr:histidine kinase [Streptacidiphilus jeojiense]